MSTIMSVDVRTKHQLSQIAQASAAFQRSCGSAQYQPSKSSRVKAGKPKPIPKMPPRRKQGVELNKQIIGSVGGVLRDHFGGCVHVQLNTGSTVVNWQGVEKSERVGAIAEELSLIVIEHINNQDDKIAHAAELPEKVKAALRAELLSADSGMLRFESCSLVPGVYRIKVKPVRKVRSGDGRPAKRIERMKTAQELRKRAA
ncbi:hypothetical protein EON76_00090 [bacterium]|nr:MAG: hypothetical protein EON76_00090 [bacterium]